MEEQVSVFALFGGIRPMARAIGEPPSNVAAWKRVGRIPAEKQPHVLEVGQALSLPITANHVVFPLGRPNAAAPLEIAVTPIAVACDPQPKTQRKDMH
jgi:hypothetical protein